LEALIRIHIESVGSDYVQLSWEVHEQAAGEFFFVSLRQRHGHHPWGTETQTSDTALRFEGLEPGTIYDVRIRRAAPTHATPHVKPLAFRTNDPGTDPANVSEVVYCAPCPEGLVLAWISAEANHGRIQRAENLSDDWSDAAVEIERKGTLNRAVLPTNGRTGFFRVR
jgi:hypothetical protein